MRTESRIATAAGMVRLVAGRAGGYARGGHTPAADVTIPMPVHA